PHLPLQRQPNAWVVLPSRLNGALDYKRGSTIENRVSGKKANPRFSFLYPRSSILDLRYPLSSIFVIITVCQAIPSASCSASPPPASATARATCSLSTAARPVCR